MPFMIEFHHKREWKQYDSRVYQTFNDAKESLFRIMRGERDWKNFRIQEYEKWEIKYT